MHEKDLLIAVELLFITGIAVPFHFESMEELLLLLQTLCTTSTPLFRTTLHRLKLLDLRCYMSMGLKYQS